MKIAENHKCPGDSIETRKVTCSSDTILRINFFMGSGAII